jgi:steroid delta-isomerase-like uncharacterized protein
MNKIRFLLVLVLGLFALSNANAESPLEAAPQAVQDFYTAFVTGDVALGSNALAEDWNCVPLNPGQVPGREGFGPVLEGYRKTFPDLQVTIDQVVVSDEYVTVRETFTGTQQGDFLGVAATGKPVTFRATDVHHIVDGKIAETWHLEDLFGAYLQLTSN